MYLGLCIVFELSMHIYCIFGIMSYEYYLYLSLSPEDDQSILIETSSCNYQFFSELITTHWEFHMVSPQTIFT